jgi:hypothetical protein
MEARFTGQTLDGARSSQVTIGLSHGAVKPLEVKMAASAEGAVECAFARVLEVRISLEALGLAAGQGLRFQSSLWEGGLPIDAIPHQGWLEMKTTDPDRFED